MTKKNTDLGYTWWAKDWSYNDKVFALDLAERGAYRELIDLAMMNDNHVEIQIPIWCRRWNTKEIELKPILTKLRQMGLIEYRDSTHVFIPSCESRLAKVRSGKKGGLKSKPGSKVESKTGSKSESNPETKHKHKHKHKHKEIHTNVCVEESSTLDRELNESVNKVFEFYNELNDVLPAAIKLNESRKKIIKARLKNEGPELIKEALQKVRESKFLTGQNKNGWKANIDFIFKEKNFLRILEGVYDDNEVKKVGAEQRWNELFK